MVADLRAVSFSCRRRRRSSARSTRKSRIAPGGFGVGRQPVVEMVAHRAFDHFLRLGGQAVLGLAHKFRFADETGDQRAAARDQVVAGDLGGLLVVDQLAIGLDALEDRGPEAALTWVPPSGVGTVLQ